MPNSAAPPTLQNSTLAIIGLGYVGLPLAVAFGKRYPTIGFDIHQERIKQLQEGFDITLEIDKEHLQASSKLTFTTDATTLKDAQIFIVTVPTPVDEFRTPDLTPLEKASTSIAKALKKGDLVIYESTVYPGATEEICVPILEKISGLTFNQDFFVGYSPERINPGDKEHRLENILKVTSGSTPEAAKTVNDLYASIIPAGTHQASSIKVAEAAKVIENTQRDLNIALINELAVLFERLGIDTTEVLEAAGTKWNFLRFRPGLVGGHCISVDPYYLTHKAQQVGYHPEVILAGRRMNDRMGHFVATQTVKMLARNQVQILGAKVLILGLTFKENCPDLRNTGTVNIADGLKEYGVQVDFYDPWANPDEALHEYGISLISEPQQQHYDAVVLAVAHRQFVQMGSEKIRAYCKNRGLIYDVKSCLPKQDVDARL